MTGARTTAGVVAVFGGAFAYFAAFRAYGFQLVDEGTILFHLASVAAGARPYVDFFTVYTPGFYHAGASIFAASGDGVGALRVALAVLNAATAAGLYALAVPVAGRMLALVAPLVWVAALPVYVGEFASFNIPYPSWLAATCWVGLTLALRTWLRGGGVGCLVAAGGLVALAVSVKINVGGAAGVMAVWVIAATTGAARGREAGVARAVAMGAALPILWAFGGAVVAREGVLLLLPAVAGLALAFGPRRAALVGSSPRRLWPALIALAVGMVLVSATWFVPLLRSMGPEQFARTVLLLDTETFDLYRTPYPDVSRAALMGLGVLATAGLGIGALGRMSVGTSLLTGIALLLAAAGVWTRWPPLMPEGTTMSVRLTLQEVAFWIVPMTHLAGVVWLARVAPARSREVFCLIVSAIAMYWQVYPRTDFMHVAIAMPLSLVLLVGLVEVGGVRRLWAGVSARGARLMVTATAAGIAVLLVAPGLRVAGGCCPDVTSATRLPVCLEQPAADDLGDLLAAAAYVRALTSEGDAVLTFPALTALPFIAGRDSAVPQAWWFPGKPDRSEEAAMVQVLRERSPRIAVTANDRLWIFHDAPRYYASLRAFVRESYRLAARFGRYDVFARMDVAAPPLDEARRRVAADERGLGSPVASYRRQAVKRMGDDIATVELPDDPRAAILWLRAVRDGGDVRSAGIVLAGLASPVPRIRREAIRAAHGVYVHTQAARYRWAGDFQTPVVEAVVARYRGAAERLRTAPTIEERRFAALLLAETPAEARRALP